MEEYDHSSQQATAEGTRVTIGRDERGQPFSEAGRESGAGEVKETEDENDKRIPDHVTTLFRVPSIRRSCNTARYVHPSGILPQV